MPMTTDWFAVVITIWLGAHPFNYTLSRSYPYFEADKCFALAERLEHHWQRSLRRKISHAITCQPTELRGTV